MKRQHNPKVTLKMQFQLFHPRMPKFCTREKKERSHGTIAAFSLASAIVSESRGATINVSSMDDTGRLRAA